MSDATISWVIGELKRIPSISVVLAPAGAADVILSVAEGPRRALHVVNIRKISRTALSSLLDAADMQRERPDGSVTLYLTPALTEEFRRRLAFHRYSWIEADGATIHLDVPPYFIHVNDRGGDYRPDRLPSDERRESNAPERPSRLTGRTAVGAEALIHWWHIERTYPGTLPPLTQKALVAVSGIAGPLAWRLLHRLEGMQVLTAERATVRTHRWRIRHIEPLVRAWANEEREPTRSATAYVYARHSGELLSKLARLTPHALTWALGGMSAANCYAPTLTADPMPVVWVPAHERFDDIAKAMGGDIVDSGANVIFKQTAKDSWATFAIVDGAPTHADGTAEIAPWVQAFRRHAASWMPARANSGVRLVSAPRALAETLREGVGRSEELVDMLKMRMGLSDE